MDFNIITTNNAPINFNTTSALLVGLQKVKLLDVSQKTTKSMSTYFSFKFMNEQGITSDIQIFAEQLPTFFGQCKIAFTECKTIDNNAIIEELQKNLHSFYFIAPVSYDNLGQAKQFININWIETIKANMLGGC